MMTSIIGCNFGYTSSSPFNIFASVKESVSKIIFLYLNAAIVSPAYFKASASASMLDLNPLSAFAPAHSI